MAKRKQILYNKTLAREWMNWVETPSPEGTREQEIFPFLEKWLKRIKPKTLADVGCGQGSCSKAVDAKIKYMGIDPSSDLIRRAKKLYSTPNRKFIEGNAYDTSLKKNSVDSIISIWVWSHLDDLKSAAKEMHRILKVGGRFLIITANPETYEERKTFYKEYAIKDNLLTGTFDLGNGKTLTNTTLYLHSKEQIKNAIRNSGLTIKSEKRMGQAESSDKGLYLIIEGIK